MESVIQFHIQLLKLVLRSSHLVQVLIGCFEVLNHVIRILVCVHGFALKLGSDVLAGFSITSASHIGTTKLGRVIVIMISLRFLGHQEKPIFKSRFFYISKQWGIRNLRQLAVRKMFIT